MNALDTVSLAYDEFSGSSELNPIILIHGMFWNKFMFKSLGRRLAQTTRRKVFSLDLRNHGESEPTNQLSMASMVEDVKRFLDEKELKKVAFVTHSLSSTVGYLIALDQPNRVERLVMVDHPPFISFCEQIIETCVLPQFRAQEDMLQRLDPKTTLRDAKDKLLGLAKNANDSHRLFLTKVAYDLTKRNGKFQWKQDFNYEKEQYAKGELSPPARGTSHLPILIVRRKDSVQIPDEKFEAVLRHNPNARLLTFSDVSHLLMLEEEIKFCRTVAEFLAE